MNKIVISRNARLKDIAEGFAALGFIAATVLLGITSSKKGEIDSFFLRTRHDGIIDLADDWQTFAEKFSANSAETSKIPMAVC